MLFYANHPALLNQNLPEGYNTGFASFMGFGGGGGNTGNKKNGQFLDGCIFYGVRFENSYLERLKRYKQAGENAFFEFGQDLVFGLTTNQQPSL